MACCKVCCGCKDCTPGQAGKCCCGGAGGTCCTTAQTCCAGSCCDTVCCNGVCCEPGQTCVAGECSSPCPTELQCGDQCCDPGETCCDGECCDLTGCTWGENRFEIFAAPYDTSPCSFVPQTKSQTIYSGNNVAFWVPPEGVNWKSPIGPGGPGETLNGCQYAIVINEVYSGCHVNFEDFDYCGGVGDYRTQIKVFRVDCSGTVSDVTDDVLEGDVYRDRYFGGIAGTACTTPSAPPFLDFYADPEFICPP